MYTFIWNDGTKTTAEQMLDLELLDALWKTRKGLDMWGNGEDWFKYNSTTHDYERVPEMDEDLPQDLDECWDWDILDPEDLLEWQAASCGMDYDEYIGKW